VTTVRIVDTTLRDGQQSLWACRMSSDAMVPTLADLDAAGFDGIEIFVASAQFTRFVRDLHEDPWNWLRYAVKGVNKTPLRLHGAIRSAFAAVPRCVQDLLLSRMSEMGVRVTRASDPWNSPEGLAKTIGAMREHRIDTVANIIYSVSPKHTVEYYAQRTRQIAALRPYRLCFKDVGGLLTPESAAEVLPVVLANTGGIPIEYHAHCNNGFAGYLSLYAADLGFEYIHTAIPPLADGSSNPSVFSLVSNLRARGHQVELDLEPLERVRAHLTRVAKLESLPIGVPQAYDETTYAHQVPGGMISNLRFQLDQLRMTDRLDEVIAEISQLRAELGYPIMVTPLSQFIGTQSVLNVISGKRYSNVPDEIIQYALGQWGSEAVSSMDAKVKEIILDRPRAAAVQASTEDEPSLVEVRARYGEALSDEELIVRVFSGLGSAPLPWHTGVVPAQTYDEYSARRPMLSLLQSLSTESIGSFSIKLGDRLTMRGVK
jgi:oxaloacetate decarboxylase alpha subunit